MSEEYITLKWGTLKSWNIESKKGRSLLKRYSDIGASVSAAMQKDTLEQKELICQMIDEIDAETIYLHWDDKEVSKEDAKKYVMEYGTE